MTPSEKPSGDVDAQGGGDSAEQTAQGESLAEGIEKDQDSTLPDYYNPLSAIPDIDERWKWITDSEGYAEPQTAEWMRMFPKDQFKSTEGTLTKKMEVNMRQMQETRKVCEDWHCQADADPSTGELQSVCSLEIETNQCSPIKTNSRSMSHNRSSSKTSARSSYLTMDHLWLHGSADQPSSDPLGRSSTTQASKTSSLLH